jgi:septum site-determining protein MinD
VSKVVVITSGKGGVGKTTTSANVATGIAMQGHKTVAIDFDVGLRNLDLVMGCERRVVYDFVNVIPTGQAAQALIRDKRSTPCTCCLPRRRADKDALDPDGVARVIEELRQQRAEYIICDSPAGTERARDGCICRRGHRVTNRGVVGARPNRVLGLLAPDQPRRGGACPSTRTSAHSYSRPPREEGRDAERGRMLEPWASRCSA